jgi:hypothetical protein
LPSKSANFIFVSNSLFIIRKLLNYIAATGDSYYVLKMMRWAGVRPWVSAIFLRGKKKAHASSYCQQVSDIFTLRSHG